jgi:hypothetical protein
MGLRVNLTLYIDYNFTMDKAKARQENDTINGIARDEKT